uniref:Caudal type homeobox 1a n=1 Tax=Amphilophus citrinellus TaxID=61819 RepID=A0A3Q0SGH1_AMPCI
MKTESAEDKQGGLTCAWRFDFSRSSRESPYLSNEDTGMYPSSPAIRQTAQTLSLNSQYIPPPYDFTSYHHHLTGVGDFSASTWNPLYTPREEYPYSFQGSSPNTAQVSFPSIFLCDSGGKTRTKDKYRVVYTDHQRMELEKEFQFNRYITMRRKSELSMALSLSERQVKIWFQNRRAKERKINRKKLQHSQQASTTTPTPPVLGAPSDAHNATTSPSRNVLSDTISEEY